MANTLKLPRAGGALYEYRVGRRDGPVGRPHARPDGPFRSRVVFAAAHVVCDPFAESGPGAPAALDWDATLAYRRYLWSLGFGVAEAMDTAQRGMGLDWPTSLELIRRALAEAKPLGAPIACGAGTDHLVPHPGMALADVEAAYSEQCAAVEQAGGRIILMASRALASVARGPDDYAQVYGRILAQVRQPVILHWLGDMFDPALAGYWGSRDLDAAVESCLQIIADHATKIDGIKLSLLDHTRELAMRRRLPPGVRMYTGDDFNYAELIRGDAHGYSDALLGIFDPIAPVASAAFQALDAGDIVGYEALLEPTVALSRHIFRRPTYSYKTGVVFLAYLNGHQHHFRMVAGQESARSIVHLAELFTLADRAGVLLDPERAAERFRPLLELAGVEE